MCNCVIILLRKNAYFNDNNWRLCYLSKPTFSKDLNLNERKVFVRVGISRSFLQVAFWQDFGHIWKTCFWFLISYVKIQRVLHLKNCSITGYVISNFLLGHSLEAQMGYYFAINWDLEI